MNKILPACQKEKPFEDNLVWTKIQFQKTGVTITYHLKPVLWKCLISTLSSQFSQFIN